MFNIGDKVKIKDVNTATMNPQTAPVYQGLTGKIGEYLGQDFYYTEFHRIKIPGVVNPMTGLEEFCLKSDEFELLTANTINASNSPAIGTKSYPHTPTTPNICNHSWKRYIGFTHIYDYCIHCDNKTNQKVIGKSVDWSDEVDD